MPEFRLKAHPEQEYPCAPPPQKTHLHRSRTSPRRVIVSLFSKRFHAPLANQAAALHLPPASLARRPRTSHASAARALMRIARAPHAYCPHLHNLGDKPSDLGAYLLSLHILGLRESRRGHTQRTGAQGAKARKGAGRLLHLMLS